MSNDYRLSLLSEELDKYKVAVFKLTEENEELKAKFNNNSLCNRIQIYEADEARMRRALEEIREIVSDTCRKRCTNECLGMKKHCGYGKILNKINEVLK